MFEQHDVPPAIDAVFAKRPINSRSPPHRPRERRNGDTNKTEGNHKRDRQHRTQADPRQRSHICAFARFHEDTPGRDSHCCNTTENQENETERHQFVSFNDGQGDQEDRQAGQHQRKQPTAVPACLPKSDEHRPKVEANRCQDHCQAGNQHTPVKRVSLDPAPRTPHGSQCQRRQHRDEIQSNSRYSFPKEDATRRHTTMH